MGRYHPPQPKGSLYITAQGAKALTDELRQLWKVERPIVTNAVHEAAKNGDRSENGDYIYGKKRLREIDSRVRFLSKRLEQLTIVSETPKNQNKVYFAAVVTLLDENDNSLTYQIVGPDEFDLRQGKISMDSPLAKALLGKNLNDEVVVVTPEGEKEYEIVEITYKKQLV